MTKTKFDIKKYLKERKVLINECLETMLPAHKGVPQEKLFEASRYSVIGSGKRIRPILTLATVETFGKTPIKNALLPACAIELVHTYSLIHDDLPCMDDDDMRRGKPSLHKKFSEDIAVLTGDHLLTSAFDILANAQFITDKQKLDLIRILAERSGGLGMIAGQVVDIDCNRPKNLESVAWMHSRKTGALISAAVEFGGILAGRPESELKSLLTFGHLIGIAFQVVDDILDVTSDEDTLGKPVRSDESNNKSTHVSLIGIEDSKRVAKSYFVDAIACLEEVTGSNDTPLHHIANFMIERKL